MFRCISTQNISFPEEEFSTSEKCIPAPTISFSSISLGENIFVMVMENDANIDSDNTMSYYDVLCHTCSLFGLAGGSNVPHLNFIFGLPKI